MLNTSSSIRGRAGKGGCSVGLRSFGGLAPARAVPACSRPQWLQFRGHSGAVATVSGSCQRMLPLNTAAQSDARASAVICKGRRARALGCER